MRKVWSLFALVTLLMVGCTCSGSTTNTIVPTTLVPDIEVRAEARKHNRQLMTHNTDRTVSVLRDCTVKKDVLVLGTSRPPNKALDGRGTGVVVSSRGEKSYIYTAAHVVEIKKEYEKGYTCKLYVNLDENLGDKKTRMDAKIFVVNSERDLAVLVVVGNLGVSTEMETDPFTGEPIWAVGYPRQLAAPWVKRLSITEGVLATINVPAGRNVSVRGYYHRVTAQTFFGNSGGGNWTSEGKLVGISVALFTGKNGVPYEGFYYIKPVSEYRTLLRESWKYWEVFGYLNEDVTQ